MSDLSDLLERQSGVVSRAQLADLDVARRTLDKMLRKRELVPIHPGVYVNHTGRPTRDQEAIAAVLYAGRACLHLEAALDRPRDSGPIQVAIDASRRVRPQPGISIHRVVDLEEKVRWNLTPPRVRPEIAALEIAHRAEDDLAAIAALTNVVGARKTTAQRLGAAMADRSRLRRRALLTSLVDDLEAGTHSVLEHGFLDRVIRPHGLPEPSARQSPVSGARGREYRDVAFAELEMFVELDSRWHDTDAASSRDADRDLDDLAQGHLTPRLRYTQVFGTPCRTADRLASIFARRGWSGTATPCSSRCPVPERGNSDGA